MQHLSAPLARGAALFLTPSDSPKSGIATAIAADHDAQNLNLESAARSRRWLVGERTELERYRSQVGSGLLPDGGKA